MGCEVLTSGVCFAVMFHQMIRGSVMLKNDMLGVQHPRCLLFLILKGDVAWL